MLVLASHQPTCKYMTPTEVVHQLIDQCNFIAIKVKKPQSCSLGVVCADVLDLGRLCGLMGPKNLLKDQ